MLILVGLLAAAALILVSATASLTQDPTAIAKVGLPLGGGTIESAVVTAAPTNRTIPTYVRDNQIWPRKTIPAHTLLTVQVVVKRPGWISWLAGKTQRLQLQIMTPSAKLTAHYLTIPAGAPLKLQFVSPVRVISYGPPGHMTRHELASPESTITLDKPGSAGTVEVAAAPYAWETSKSALVSWFPNGSAGVAVANPQPGSKILPGTPITLTFNKPVSKVLGSDRPPVPGTPGTWHTVNDHSITFQPAGYGYGLGSTRQHRPPERRQAGRRERQLRAPGRFRPARRCASSSCWRSSATCPTTSIRRWFGVALNPAAQMAAAIHPPTGNFSLKWRNTPSALTEHVGRREPRAR